MNDDLPDRVMELVMEERGGCRCQDPGAAPPCWACSTEPSDAELRLAQELCQDERDQAEDAAAQADVDQLIRDAAAEW